MVNKVFKITTSESPNDSGHFVSLFELDLSGENIDFSIQYESTETPILSHMKVSRVLQKQPPFNFSIREISNRIHVRIDKILKEKEVKFMLYHKNQTISIGNFSGDVEYLSDKNFESLRIVYANSQPEFTISHEKQDECLKMLDKVDDLSNKNEINLLYVGPDDLSNLKTILYYLQKKIRIAARKINLHVATSPVGETDFSDKSNFNRTHVLGVKISERIPHGTPTESTYDIVIDCFTFPIWGNENDTKHQLEQRMSILSPSGSLILVTPISTSNSIFFEPNNTNLKEKFYDCWPGGRRKLTKILQCEDDEDLIYSCVIRKDSTHRSSDSTVMLAEKILEFNPLFGNLNDPISINNFSLPKVIDDSGKEVELNDVMNSYESRNIIIHGKGGIGKSTSAKYLASLAFSKHNTLPLILSGNQLDKIINKETECVDASITNLFGSTSNKVVETYKRIIPDYDKILLIFDQLDDLDKEEYPARLRRIITKQIPNQFKDCEIDKVVIFSRQEIPIMGDAVSLQMKPLECDDIVELIDGHRIGLKSPEIKKIVQQIEDEGYPLVRSDIPFLVEYILKEDSMSPNYGFYKGRTIPRIMLENNDRLMEQVAKPDLEKILSIIFNYLYHKSEVTSIDEIYSNTREVFPKYDDKTITEIIVSSRLFTVTKDNHYSISAHDTIKDTYAAQFYRYNHHVKPLYEHKGFEHALDISHIKSYSSRTKRIMNSYYDICNNLGIEFTNAFLDVLIDVFRGKNVASKNIGYEECIMGCLEVAITKNCSISFEDLPDKIWKFYEWDEENIADRENFVKKTLNLYDETNISKLRLQLQNNERQESLLKRFISRDCINELRDELSKII